MLSRPLNKIIMFEAFLMCAGVYFLIVSNSPFFIVLSVITVSLSLGLILLMSLNSWMFYSLVVMFLGGMMVAFSYSSSVNMHFKPMLVNKADTLFILILTSSSLALINEIRLWAMKGSHSYNIYTEFMVPSLILMVGMIMLALSVLMKVLPAQEGPLKMKN